MIVGIMVGACYVNRLRNYPIIPRDKSDQGLLGLDKLDPRDEEDLLSDDSDEQQPLTHFPESSGSTEHAPKKRSCCGTVIQTPNSSRYANHLHSRFIQKFPFLVEMFYWAVNLLFYVSVKKGSELIFSTDGVWETAEKHGIAVLELEHNSIFSFLFPLREVDVQQFFRLEHQTMLTILNRAYSLIHIPVTVR